MTLFRGDSLEELQFFKSDSVDAVVTDPPYGLSFMGKKWDYDVPSVELWREVFRVMKPGAHLLSFGGTRTYHRMVVNIEDAGFEVRDQVQWIYGSGFPKSLDVSKAIDKAAGIDRPRVPGGQGGVNTILGSRKPGEAISGEAISGEAKQWSGWGTALKPANEPIVLARKPIEKGLTVAENVLKWGTGALNIDGTRIGTEQIKVDHKKGNSNSLSYKDKNEGPLAFSHSTFHTGRWPANVLFDEEAAAVLDEQSGQQSARGGMPKDKSDKPGQIVFAATGGEKVVRNDSGGASRFFYVAKASKRERNAGLEGMPEVLKSHIASKDGGGGGWAKDAHKNPNLPRANHHPTVKPIKLMEYLIKLITPPSGTVLDPFMGSGSTGVAAKNLGFEFIGIEREKEYFEIAKKRIGA